MTLQEQDDPCFCMDAWPNTVLVKQCRLRDYITERNFSFNKSQHFKFNDIRQPKASLATFGLS
jgi:hypothetical protein